MEEGTLLGPGPDGSRACPDCGWQGPEASMRPSSPGSAGAAADGGAAGGGDDGAAASACPRCGSPLAPGLPSVAEILAARRTPEA